MKRVRAGDQQLEQPLGASEFAAVLNGDDPRSILDCLKRFVSTVSRERRIAQSIEEEHVESSDDESNDEDETTNSSNQKRFRKDESWKHDTANYNVPFVGTAVSSVVDSGKVVKGVWPTGLLQSYLQKSPVAVELTGDLLSTDSSRVYARLQQNKRCKLASSIKRAYLLALCSLISAAVPKGKLLDKCARKQDDEGFSSAAEYRFVAALLKDRIPGLLILLRDETGNGRGKASIVGGCGPLAYLVIRVLTQLAMTSMETARYVARTMEQNLPDGVLRLALKPQAKRPSLSEPRSKASPRELARVEALRLASALVDVDDAVIVSCLCSVGDKERKVPPGILFVALNDGLAEIVPASFKSDSDLSMGLCQAGFGLLRSVRNLLGRPHLSFRLVSSVFSRDAMQALVKISLSAPSLSDGATYESVLKATDCYSSLTLVDELCIEARRLVFTLATDTVKSSLLRSLAMRNASSKQSEHILTNSLVSLLEGDQTMETQRFLLHCVVTTPGLFAPFFRAVQFPDMNRPFLFVSHLNILSKFIRSGPSAASCLQSVANPHGSEDLLLCAFVPHQLKQQTLSKGLQSTNPLVVSETLKFLYFALVRNRNFLNALEATDPLAARAKAELTSRLPDFNTLIGTMSRFSDIGKSSNAIVFGQACRTLRVICLMLPELLKSRTVDWIKLLPTPLEFSRTPHHLQLVVLSTIDAVFACCKVGSANVTSFAFLAEITICTKNIQIHAWARKLAITVFVLLLGVDRRSEDASNTLQFFASSIVDLLTEATISECCNILKRASSNHLSAVLSVAKAFRNAEIPVPSRVSSLALAMVRFVQGLPTMSVDFSQITCLIVAKCMFFDDDPLSIAVQVVNVSPQMDDNVLDWSLASFKSLQDYSDAVVRAAGADITVGNKPDATLLEMLLPSFAVVQRSTGDFSVIGVEDTINILRVAASLAEGLQEGPQLATCNKAMLRLLPFIVLATTQSEGATSGLSDSSMRRAQVAFRRIHEISKGIPTSEPLWNFIIISGGGLGDEQDSLGASQKYDVPMHGSNKGTFDSMYLRLCAPFFPSYRAAQALTTVLTSANHTPAITSLASTEDTALILVQKLGNDKGFLHSRDPVHWHLMDTVLSSWLELTKSSTRSAKENDLILYFQQLLVSWLSTPCKSLLYAKMLVFGCDDLVSACLATIAVKTNTACAPGCLLNAMVRSDPVAFVPKFMVQICKDPLPFELPESLLDEALSTALEHPTLIPNTVSQERLVDVILKLLQSRASKHTCKATNAALGLLLSRQSAGIFHGETQGKVSTALVEVASEAFALYLIAPKTTCETFIKRSIELCSDAAWSQYASVMLLSMLAALNRTFAEPSKLLDQSIAKPHDLVDWTCELVERIQELDVQDYTIGSGVVDLLDASVRAGLHIDSTVPLATKISGFRLASKLLKSFACSDSCFGRMASLCTTVPAMLVLNVIKSHTNFQVILVGDGISCEQKSAFVSLLRVLLIGEGSLFDKVMLRSLMGAYNGGVSRMDKELRLLIQGYCGLATQQVEGLFVNEWQYCGAFLNTAKAKSDDLGWVLDGISARRVLATIRHFPLEDPLDPTEDTSDEESKPGRSTEDKPDQRYSPGFLLPLVLSLLGLVTDGTHAVEVVQRLCDHGVMALSLASLCSHCLSLRRVGFAILGLMHGILMSEAARRQTSWRERPQLAMLLRSVQRSILLRAGRNGSKIESLLSEGPALPSVAAVFLAKAALVLSQPASPLFVGVNRYFLRSEEDHGAFDDPNRLPLFVALFCSSAIDSEQFNSERVWALDLIRESFLDESCYKALMSCHAPELLLSSSLTVDPRSENERASESSMVFEVIDVVLIRGGERAANHLIGRLGLLAFLRSLLLGRPLLDVFPFVASRQAFLRLLATSLAIAKKLLSPDEYSSVTRGLANPVLSLFDSIDRAGKSSAQKDAPISYSHDVACKCIGLLRQGVMAESTCDHDIDHDFQKSEGVSLARANMFLQGLSNQVAKPIVADAIATFPWQFDLCESKDVASLCGTILRVTHGVELTEHQKVRILRRIASCSLALKHKFDANGDILEELLEWRSECFENVDVRATWISCVSQMVDCHDESSVPAVITAKLLLHNLRQSDADSLSSMARK